MTQTNVASSQKASHLADEEQTVLGETGPDLTLASIRNTE